MPTEITSDMIDRAVETIQDLNIEDDSEYRGDKFVKATKWFVVYTRTAEPDVNYPGELVEECESYAAARKVLARTILEAALNPTVRKV